MDSENANQVRDFVRKTQITAILTGVTVGLILLYLWSRSVGLGFISGVVVSVINFQLMAVDAFQMAGKIPGKARKFIIGRYIIRYAILFVFFAVIVTRTDFNIFAAFTGLFFIQFILVCGRLFRMAGLILKTSRS